jgi:hypothetical protein
MTFADLLTEVYFLTNRPDLVNETKSAVKAATLKLHQTDFYSKDIAELYIDLGSATDTYIYSFDYISAVSNFRAIKYIRKLNITTGEPEKFFDIITPEETLDSYNVTRTDVCYVAGRVLEIRSSTTFNKMILGVYVFPIAVESGYSSWIAELYPYAIIFEATRIIFKTIGYDEQSSAYRELVAEQVALLKLSALPDYAM